MGSVAPIPPTSTGYIWPISAQELTFNSLMVGN